jgi:DNA helicase TIP49 (TBP-interacting protein)
VTNAPDDNDDFDSSAADEPTAMWGADALKDLGLEEAAKAHEEPKAVVAQPALRSQTLVTRSVPKPKTVPKRRAASAGPSWTVTIALAIAVAAGVFFGVRAILG